MKKNINIEKIIALMEESMEQGDICFMKEEKVDNDHLVVIYYIQSFFEYVHYKCGHTQILWDNDASRRYPVVMVEYTINGPVYTVWGDVLKHITFRRDSEGDCAFGYMWKAEKDYKCPFCKRKEVKEMFIKDYSPNFKGMVFDHGLAAYRGCKSSKEIAQAVSNIISHPEWEICVTEQYDAPSQYGISVTGSLTGLYEGDVWSEIEEGGERLPAPEHADDIIRDPERMEYAIQMGWADYLEGFMKEVKVEAVWIRRHFCRHINTAKVLRDLAKELGVPFRVY